MRQAAVLILLLAAPAFAHEPAELSLEPDESVTVTCDYRADAAVPSGTTCSDPGTVAVTVRKGSDGTPTGIITSGPTCDGSNITMVVDPGGSRHGNRYQVHTVGTFSNGDKLACNFVVDVRTVTFR